MKTMFVCCTLLLLAACQSNNRHRPNYESFIQTEQLVQKNRIQQFRFQGWQPLSDRYLILRGSQNRSYLIKLLSSCHELPFAQSLELKQDFSSGLSAKFDSVIVPGQINQECTIGNIYEMNKDQLKALLAFSNNQEAFR